MCLFPDVEVLHSVTKSMAIYQMVYLVFESFVMGIAELWPFHIGKECSLQCIS